MILTIVVGVAVVMIAVEWMARARAWPRVRGWYLRALLLNGAQFGIAWVAGQTWERWFASRRLWSIDELGTWPSALIGYFAITFVYYWWHRLRHDVPCLWRWLHQVHHSPSRIEIITSFYKHPAEILINSWISTAVLYFIVGVSAEASAYAILLTGLAEFFYHWNIRTPYWLGFLIQRPESHCVHHERGRHRDNYADLPLWDILFGTFDNPRAWNSACGFERNAEERLGEMLTGKEVT